MREDDWLQHSERPVQLLSKVPMDRLDRGVLLEGVASKFSPCAWYSAQQENRGGEEVRHTNSRLLLASERHVVREQVVLVDPHLSTTLISLMIS